MTTQQTETKKNGAQPQAATPKPTTALAPAAQQTLDAQTGEIVRVGFDTLQGFVALQRIGAAFAASSLVPEQYQRNPANCIIAIEMAARMGASPLMVMQNLYLIHGRPSWSAQFAIASFNNCRRFEPIRYKWTGEKSKASWGCIAWTRDVASGELIEGPEVTIGTAKAEGWTDKKGSKWLTLPQLMLTYRAATFLIRTTAPDLLMGLRTVEEAEDIGHVEAFDAPTPGGVAGLKALVANKAAEQQPAAEPEHNPETGEVTEPAGDGPSTDELEAIRAAEREEAARS